MDAYKCAVYIFNSSTKFSIEQKRLKSGRPLLVGGVTTAGNYTQKCRNLHKKPQQAVELRRLPSASSWKPPGECSRTDRHAESQLAEGSGPNTPPLMDGKLSPADLRALCTHAKLSAHSLSGASTVSDVPAPTDSPSPHAEPDPMPETKPGSGEGVCQRGCGLSLSGDPEHCCVDALRAVTDTLEGRSAGLEQQVRVARLRWNRREQWLLARVTALQNEARLAALQYQQRLHRYMVHIGSIAEQVNRYCQVRPRGCLF